jgi:FSR family fosmidomycin resistance protein-like MFS transporter
MAARLGWREAAALMALPALAAAAFVWWLVREPAIRGARGLRAGVTRPLLLLTLVNGLALAVVAGFVTFLPAYYAGQGANLALAGVLTAPTLAAGLVAQPIGGGLSDRFGRRAVFVGALLALGACVIAFPFASGPTLAVVALLAGFFGSVTPPVTMIYAAELAPGGRTGQAVGLAWGAGIAISSLAAPLTGALIDRSGFTLAFGALGVVALVAAVVALALPRGRTHTPEAK